MENSSEHEQANGYVVLDGTARPLPIQNVFRNSSAVFWVRSRYVILSLSVKIGNADATGYVGELEAHYHESRGLWRVYVPGRYFKSHCETEYKFVCVDSEGGRHVLGIGKLRVHGYGIDDPDDEVHDAPTDTAFVGFDDGKWREIMVSEDEVGELVFSVSDKEYAAGDFAAAPTDLYAYDKAYGMYFRVVGKIDETGNPTVEVVGDPVDGADAFAVDRTTNLYYRVESKVDEVGERIITIGDKRV